MRRFAVVCCFVAMAAGLNVLIPLAAFMLGGEAAALVVLGGSLIFSGGVGVAVLLD